MERAEVAEAKNKKLDMELLARDQEITSLQVKLARLDADLEKADGELATAKRTHEEGDTAKSTAETLGRKIQILEEELDSAEKNLKETVERYVVFVFSFSGFAVMLVAMLLMGLLSPLRTRLDCGRWT